jgi:Golgi phosphoprotein 3 (GPP34)
MRPSDGLPTTLAGRAYLAMYDRDHGRLMSRRWSGQLLGAAAVADLFLRGYLTDDGGLVKPAAELPAPDNSVLATVWQRITDNRPRRWQHWIRQRDIENLVRADLTGRWIRVERPAGFLRRARISPRDPRALTRLHGLVTAALRGPTPVDRLPQGDVMLVALLAVADVHTVISRGRRREHARRIDQMIELAGPPAAALRRVIAQARHMLTAGG